MEMKNTLSFAAVAVLAGLITTGTSQAVTNSKPDNSSITAQSAQVHTDGLAAVYYLDEGGTGARKFLFAGKPDAVAAFNTYFTYSIAWTSGSAQPNASHIENAMHEAFKANKDNFRDGTALIAVATPFSRSGSKGTITATPKAPGIYPAGTGYEHVEATDLTVTVSDIFISSESYVKKSKASDKWSRKYSYSMLNPDLTSRLVGVTIELLKDGEVIETRTPENTVELGQDWFYEANAGTFGNATAKLDLITDNEVSAILAADDFAGNNGIGGSRGRIADQTFTITAAGNYAVRISGTIKGNTVDPLTQGFTVQAPAAIVN